VTSWIGSVVFLACPTNCMSVWDPIMAVESSPKDRVVLDTEDANRHS
jgi:hypothetical protein